MNVNYPLVSICIPTYNGELFIEESINSALNQTYRNIEIIISDDSSQDNTLEKIQEISSNQERPITILHHTPSGIGANWNNCLTQASGKYIKFLFQDDILAPECIAKMVAVGEEDHHVGLVFCQRQIIGDAKAMKYELSKEQTTYERIFEGKRIIANSNFFDNPKNKIGEPPSVMIRQSVIEKIGIFDTRLKQSLDYEYWHRICKYYKVGFIPQPLSKFRMHDHQASSVNKKTIVIDKVLLPWMMIRTHFWQMHLKAKWKVIDKLVQGFFRYYFFNKI